MVTVKIFHGFEVKRFRFGSMKELTNDNLQYLLKENFKSFRDEHCLKYLDDEGDLCTLTKSTFSDAFARALENKASPSAQQGLTTVTQSESAQAVGSPQGTRAEVVEQVIHLFACESVAVPTTTLWNQREFPWVSGEPEAKSIGQGIFRPREIHSGITCDGCGTIPLCGIRYKCAECVDFDLCSSCYDTPPTEEIVEHAALHGFIQMSARETMRQSRRGVGRYPLAFPRVQSEQPEPEPITPPVIQARQPGGTLSPRVGSEWTEVSIGAPHIEGLLRAFGIDIDSAKGAVRKFIATGDFQEIVEHLKVLKNAPVSEAVGTPPTSAGSQ